MALHTDTPTTPRQAITPPVTLVSISTPPDMLVIAPASALISPPAEIAITPTANAGLYLMSTCMPGLPR